LIDQTILKDRDRLKQWIESRTDNPVKNITLERQLFAFCLLECIISMEIEFIFKGGTALILLLDETKRFSTDIDILISRPDMSKLESLFSKIANPDSIFIKFVKDERADVPFPKAHYKFFFNSIYKNDDQDGYILLDAVFEKNPYLNIVKKQVKNDVLFSTEPYLSVSMPSITDIMIDKLTAFAPHTIGVRFERVSKEGASRDQSREVIKQWFDVNELYKKFMDKEKLKLRYISLSRFEIEQRNLEIDYSACLTDTIHVVLCYLSKGKRNPETYEKMKKGIRSLNSFVNTDLNESYFISASVNIIELISYIFCDSPTEYNELFEISRKKIVYEDFINQMGIKKIVDLVRVNNTADRDRLLKSLRVISNFIVIR
jgi:hypothetical protein